MRGRGFGFIEVLHLHGLLDHLQHCSAVMSSLASCPTCLSYSFRDLASYLSSSLAKETMSHFTIAHLLQGLHMAGDVQGVVQEDG